MKYLFESESLGFRRFKISDVEKVYTHHNEQSLKKWIPNESYENLDEATDAIKFFGECYDKRKLPFVLAIEEKRTQEIIGDTGINEAPGGIEIGYSIRESHQGNGYATETVKAMTKYVCQIFSVNVLFGRVMNGNNASCKVMDKTGYRFIREEFGAEDDPYGKGMLVYELDSAN